MASWLMRMVVSSGKSIGRRRAICSGLQALAHRRSCRGPCRRPFQATAGPGTGTPLGATTTPANLSSHISAQGRVEGKLRRLRAPGRSLGMPLGGRRAILQPTAAGGCVAPQLPGDRRGGSTEPAPDLLHGMALDPQKRNLLTLQQRQVSPGERLGRGSEHRWGHAACLSEPSVSRQAATHRPRPQHPRCSFPLRSPTRTGAVHRVPPQAAGLVTATALAQTDPTAAFECSSQPPPSGCCDDRLNPPNMCRSSTPSASPRPASSPRSAASATATTMPWPKPSSACSRPR